MAMKQASTDIEALRTRIELANELDKLPDSANVGWKHAAVMLNVSEPPSRRSLERWRQARTKDYGPMFTKGGGKTSAVVYNAGELRQWLTSRTHGTTMEAAGRRVVAFASVHSLVQNEPWVIGPAGAIHGHALTAPDNDLRRALHNQDGFHLDLGSLTDALTCSSWLPEARAPFHTAFLAVLSGARAEADFASLSDGVPDTDTNAGGSCSRCGKPAHPGKPCRL